MADSFKSHAVRPAGTGDRAVKSGPRQPPRGQPVPKEKLSRALAEQGNPQPASDTEDKVEEVGGPKGPEPTRYGDWEIGGRCIDF